MESKTDLLEYEAKEPAIGTFGNDLFIEAFDGSVLHQRINNLRTALRKGILNAAGNVRNEERTRNPPETFRRSYPAKQYRPCRSESTFASVALGAAAFRMIWEVPRDFQRRKK